MTVYYNDIDPFVCAWLEELMKDGLISAGEIDDRSIADIDPGDLSGFTRCHFFAGIGGWDLALQMAGWPDDRPVWTGSCPCQPFSSAGKRKGVEDDRHLWPAFSALIAERRPATVFGEQVASSDGRAWLAGVFADLEDMGYRAAGADLCAAGVGSPHIRQRLWWVGDSSSPGSSELSGERNESSRPTSAGWHSGLGLVRCDEPHRTVHRRTPLEPSLFPVADGIPNRVGILRGAGNAIVPQVAAEFVAAYVECDQ